MKTASKGVWPGRYVIGLTGNIGTGKTTVRLMLEELGAFGIDADNLGHRTLDRCGPAYGMVVSTFGHGILTLGGEIDRQKLAHAAFNAPDQLDKLEAIIHPIVRQEINVLVTQTLHPVVVVEAIKLIEGGFADKCDAVWVVEASREQQLERLAKQRHMTIEETDKRMRYQTSQASKASRADVLIQNDGDTKDTRSQVGQAWNEILLEAAHLTRAGLAAQHQ